MLEFYDININNTKTGGDYLIDKKKVLTFTMTSMLMLNSMTGLAFAKTNNQIPSIQTAKPQTNVNIQLHENKLHIPSLIKDNITYVSLRDFANSLNLELRWDSETKTVKVYIPETMPNAYIVDISKENNTIKVSTSPENKKPEDMFIFHIFENTFENEDKTIKLDDFKAGDKVTIKHAKQVALSMPPQSTAYRIIKQENEIQKAKILKNDLQAQEITIKYLDENNKEKTIILTYGGNTTFTHNGLTKQLLVPNDYKTGNYVDITFTENLSSEKPHITIIKKLVDL